MTREKINYQNFLPQDLDQKLSALQPLLDQENEVLRRDNQLLVKKDNIKMGILCKVAGSLMPAGIANGHIWQLVQNNGNSLLSKCTFNQLCKTSNRKIMHLCMYLAYKTSKREIELRQRSLRIYFLPHEVVVDQKRFSEHLF